MCAHTRGVRDGEFAWHYNQCMRVRSQLTNGTIRVYFCVFFSLFCLIVYITSGGLRLSSEMCSSEEVELNYRPFICHNVHLNQPPKIRRT